MNMKWIREDSRKGRLNVYSWASALTRRCSHKGFRYLGKSASFFFRVLQNGPWKTFAAFFALILWAVQSVAAIDVESRFDPSAISQDEVTVYRIIISGSGDGQLEGQLPNVQGLRILGQNRSSKMEFDFRSVVRETTYSFRMRADRPGEYQIPAFSVLVDGERQTVPAATLMVVKAEERSGNKPLSLSFELPTETLYVGQTVPCDVLVYVQPDIQLKFNRFPIKEGDAFTEPQFKQFAFGGDTLIDGKGYRVYKTSSILTALKANDHPLSFNLDLRVSIPHARRGGSFDPFGFFSDSFFNQFETVSLYTETRNYSIKPLPLQGKPDAFTGAIGLFSIRPILSATQVRVGDPLTLKLEVTGEGNFDRIQAPDLVLNNDWKAYDPKSTFQPSDEIGYQGTKTFEYILIPKSEKLNELPEIPFNFFNPEDAEYIEVLLPSIPLTITPGENRKSPFPLPQYVENLDIPKSPKLLPLMQVSDPGWVHSIRPLFATRLFWLGQLVPLLALLALYGVRCRHLRLIKDPDYARRRRGARATERWRQTAQKASTRNDTIAFFIAAQKAIQESVGRFQSGKAEALTLTEIKTFLEQKNADTDLVDKVKEFFQAADSSRFSASSIVFDDLHLYQCKLNTILKNLEKFV